MVKRWPRIEPVIARERESHDDEVWRGESGDKPVYRD